MDPLSRLHKDLSSEEFRPNPIRGQNFTSCVKSRRRLIETADIQPTDIIIEIGTGTGIITWELAQRASRVFSLEIDPILAAIARRNLADFPHVEIVEGEGTTWLRERLECDGWERQITLVSSLPYSESTPILSLIASYPDRFRRISLLLAAEFAEKVAAPAGDSRRTALSVVIQTAYVPSVSPLISPSKFFPRPHIQSIILGLSPREHPETPDWALYQSFIMSCFAQKRKTLWNNLRHRFPWLGVDILKSAGLENITTRAEQVPIEVFLHLNQMISEVQDKGKKSC